MWVCRAGKESIHYDLFIENNRIYLPWEGFRQDLSNVTDASDYYKIVADEKKIDSRPKIASLACQLSFFSNQMAIGDYVLVPAKGSKTFTLCRVIGNYKYSPTDELPHSRPIEILQSNIDKSIFPQKLQNSLGSFRTIFRVKDEKEVLKIIKMHLDSFND